MQACNCLFQSWCCDDDPSLVGSVKLPDIKYFHLQLIKWIDPNGEEAKLKIYKEMSSKWKEVAGMIGLSKAEIDNIAAPGMGREMTDCMRDVFGKWMENSDTLPNHTCYPLTWDGLCNILQDSDSDTLVKRLKEALAAEQSTLRNTFPAKQCKSLTFLSLVHASQESRVREITPPHSFLTYT